jgi:hypothetical protein
MLTYLRASDHRCRFIAKRTTKFVLIILPGKKF